MEKPPQHPEGRLQQEELGSSFSPALVVAGILPLGEPVSAQGHARHVAGEDEEDDGAQGRARDPPAARSSLQMRGWGTGGALRGLLRRTPRTPHPLSGSPVALEALRFPQVRAAPLLRLEQRLAGGPGVIGQGEAVGDGLHLLGRAGQIAAQICGAKTRRGPRIPPCAPKPPFAPRRMWQPRSP